MYVTMSKFFGPSPGLPSVYWAFVNPGGEDLCNLTVTRSGVIASADGLSLAYPTVAGREDGGAVVSYSFSGNNTQLTNGQGPAFAGQGVLPSVRLRNCGQDQCTRYALS